MDSTSDKCNMKETCATLNVVSPVGGKEAKNQSPLNLIPILMYEGGDSFAEFSIHGEKIRHELQQLAHEPLDLGDGRTVEIVLLESLDGACLNEERGCSSHGAACCCAQCTQNIHQAPSQRPAAEKRSAEWVIKTAHLIVPGVVDGPYDCPLCGKRVEKSGDHGPTNLKDEESVREWQREHLGQKYLRRPWLHFIDIDDCIPDVLHLLLRVVGQLYYHTVQKYCHKNVEVKALHDFLKTHLGITCSSQKKTKKSVDKTEGSSDGEKKESFTGEECAVLLDRFQDLLEFAESDLIPGSGRRPKIPPEEAKRRHERDMQC